MKKILLSIPQPLLQNWDVLSMKQVWDTAVKFVTDTISANISIFPNPALQNSVIAIKTNKVQTGNYLVSIFDEKGAFVQLSSISIQRKKDEAELTLGNLAAGKYFLHLRNKRSGKQFIKKLIVQ